MSDAVEEEAAAPRRGVAAWCEVRFRSPAAIYGLIVFAALITIASDHAEDAWDMLASSVSTLVVFFIAHVFAHTLTDHAERGLGPSTRSAVRHAAGMLYASIPSTLVLVAGGMLGIPPDDLWILAVDAALVVLAVLGYAAYARRSRRVFVRLLGALGTASLGFLIILLEYALH